MVAEVRVELGWERLRNLLRYRIIAGDVTMHDGSFDTARSRSLNGLDTDRLCDYAQLVKAFWKLGSNDPLGHDLLKRNVGFHCADERCIGPRGRGPGHWHSQSWSDLMNVHAKEYLQRRFEEARTWLVKYCVDLTA